MQKLELDVEKQERVEFLGLVLALYLSSIVFDLDGRSGGVPLGTSATIRCVERIRMHHTIS